MARTSYILLPENLLFTESVNILAMVIIGGMGSLPGVVLGAAIVVTMPELFRDFQSYRLLAFGLLLMVLMIFRPEGLLARRPRPRPATSDEPAAGLAAGGPALGRPRPTPPAVKGPP